jgi:uncharacterized membrane protein
MSRTAKIVLGVVGLLVAIQLVPVSRTNPPVESEPAAPPEVQALLKKACYDCHSHQTVWPLQAYVAPFSWLVAHDVKEARQEMNFSRWGSISREQLGKYSLDIPKEVEKKKEMPPGIYLLAHPEARLTDAERAAIAAWASGLGK